MKIPSKMHFGLGFGFKYQYFVATLLHALITNKKFLSTKEKNKVQDYMEKELLKYPAIHENPEKFINKLTNIIPDINNLKNNKNALFLLEGESYYFEDINLFTTNKETSIINFIQIKGGDSQESSMNTAIKKTLSNMLKNKNKNIPSKLIIITNSVPTRMYLLNKDEDKIKVINETMKSFYDKEVKNKALKNKIAKFMETYIKATYNNTDIKTTNKQVENIFENLDLNGKIKNLKKIIDNTTIIKQLDYRLIYLFLYYHYGHNKLTKILWNIEMKSMNAEDISTKNVQLKLRNINFNENYISEIKFCGNSDTSKFKKGKIL